MRKLLILASLCPLVSLSQPKLTSQKILPITIGEALPLAALNHQLKSPTTKLVILDFFATWCVSCIKELPKLDSLQKAFSGKVQFVMVAYEPPDAIDALRGKLKKFASLTIPVITSDTILSQYFPHRSLPHTVWLDERGVVHAITGAEEVSAANLQAMLDGKQLHLPVKKDLVHFDIRQPLLSHEGAQNALRFQSVLSGPLAGTGSSVGITRDTAANLQRFTAINQSLIDLIEIAAGQPFSNRWRLDLPDSPLTPYGDLFSLSKTPWCYERTLPLNFSKEGASAWTQADICRSFGITITRKKEVADCWVLTADSTANQKLKTKGGGAATTLYAKDSGVKYLRNGTISRLVKALNSSTPGRPVPIVLDETGIRANIDISLTIADLQDLLTLSKLLPSYGLHLLPARREIEFLVIARAMNQSPSQDSITY